ncbi:hypothetical protein [uncultured Methanobrevibacter sp.]|uniref:hypothetical protein n=1 Tax=uncultured Methanobrevibacter sp. TaxID=253161 RepID=UPI0025E2A0E9|nr:hypothetical protein [uncultured Methanobrevibacter sp.]
MNFAFSSVGLLFLVMLMIPNIMWSKNQPKDYEKYSSHENSVLVAIERIGEVAVSIFALFCGVDFADVSILTVIAFVLMILYEIYWIRYFRSERKMSDMYCNMFGIPLPGATLPVFAFLILGISCENMFLIAFSVILGIGHIGIHMNHKRELKK